eukprot:883430-Pelagomonas_calceolata.AAC.1
MKEHICILFAHSHAPAGFLTLQTSGNLTAVQWGRGRPGDSSCFKVVSVLQTLHSQMQDDESFHKPIDMLVGMCKSISGAFSGRQRGQKGSCAGALLRVANFLRWGSIACTPHHPTLTFSQQKQISEGRHHVGRAASNSNLLNSTLNKHRSVEEGTTRDELQAQARHHFSIALQQLALSASTSPAPTTRTGALADNHHVGLGSGLDLACCQHLHPYSPVVETVRANASSALSSSASGGGSSSPRRRMAIVSPVLPHALATYVLQRCGLEEAVSMLTPTWEQGVLQTSPSPQPSTSCSNISSSSGSSSSRSGGQDLWQSDQAIQDSGWRGVAAQGHGEDNERPAHLTHLFTPNLAHAQRMVRELGSSASSRTRSTTNSSSTSNSRDQATYSSAGRRGLTPSSSSSAWRDALEHAFSSSNSSSGSGSSRADTNNVKDDEHSQQGWQSGPFLGPKVQQMCFEVHLAEWACSSQPSRAKALGHEGLHLTDEVRLAELAGCASSRAVLDGVEWQ